MAEELESDKHWECLKSQLTVSQELVLNQNKKIGQLEAQVNQLKAIVQKEQEKHAVFQHKHGVLNNALVREQMRSKSLQSKIDEMASINQTAKNEEAMLKKKLKDSEEERDRLENQLTNSKDFLLGIASQINEKFGTFDPGVDKLLNSTLTEGK